MGRVMGRCRRGGWSMGKGRVGVGAGGSGVVKGAGEPGVQGEG